MFILSLILVLVVLAAGLALLLYFFFRRNDAPILHGHLEYNVRFKDKRSLDVYLPTQDVFEKTPVLIYVHGGAWIMGRKETVNNARFNEAFNMLREQGYAVVSPEYTLAKFGHTPFPACIEDVFDAIHWIEREADSHNFDLENVGILGESAGGHIALMVGYDEMQLKKKRYSFDLKYIVAVYPPTELYKLYQDQSSLIEMIQDRTQNLPASIREHLDINQYLFGFDPESEKDRAIKFAASFSPLEIVSAQVPDTLLIHGDKDRVVPVSQSHMLKEKLDELGVTNEMHILEGVDHAFRGANPEQHDQVQAWIKDFVVEHYKA